MRSTKGGREERNCGGTVKLAWRHTPTACHCFSTLALVAALTLTGLSTTARSCTLGFCGVESVGTLIPRKTRKKETAMMTGRAAFLDDITPSFFMTPVRIQKNKSYNFFSKRALGGQRFKSECHSPPSWIICCNVAIEKSADMHSSMMLRSLRRTSSAILGSSAAIATGMESTP